MNWSRCYSCDATLTEQVYRLDDRSFCWSCRQAEDSSDNEDSKSLPYNKWKNKDTYTSSNWKVVTGMWAGLLTFTRELLAIFSEQEASGRSYTDPYLYIALNQAAPC